MSDMFNLYEKVRKYALCDEVVGQKRLKTSWKSPIIYWTNRMKSRRPLVVAERKRRAGAEDRASFQNFSFNFDSAAGIIYTVDVTRPKGEKVTIVSMADGSPFRMDHIYKVAL